MLNVPRNRQGNLLWTNFESGTENLLKAIVWFFHHLAKCTDMLLYVCSAFDFNVKYCLLMIQLNGKIQMNFARIIYLLNGVCILSQ